MLRGPVNTHTLPQVSMHLMAHYDHQLRMFVPSKTRTVTNVVLSSEHGQVH